MAVVAAVVLTIAIPVAVVREPVTPPLRVDVVGADTDTGWITVWSSRQDGDRWWWSDPDSGRLVRPVTGTN